MMHHMSSEENLHNGLAIQQPQPQAEASGLAFSDDINQLHNFNWNQNLGDSLFDQQDMNRRTITQENFDAMMGNGGMVHGTGEFQSFDASFSGDQHAINQIFSGFDAKQQDFIGFPYAVVPPSLSSHDSTVPSLASEHGMPAFPSSNTMQHHHSMSASGSEWAESRSSSLASVQHAAMGAPVVQSQPQQQASTSQWEPGKSVAVDVNAMKEEFQRVAQQNQIQASMDQPFEQPLAWPSDDAYARRGSTTSLLAQSMGQVGIHTPQPGQTDGVFKSPAPPTTIAARRKRDKPANLSLGMRSQSFAGAGQPNSPSQNQQQMPQGQQIRRAMSSTVLQGGVAQGRVMKSVPGSAQRSPLNWTFNDALNSPHLVRAVSQGNLAPPTPMSPSHPSQAQQVPNFQNGGQLRQPSINENEEHQFTGTSYQSSSVVPPHVSPPHTPHWYQQTFVPQRVGSTVITENTPPQSAPASQSCFPSNVFGLPSISQPQMPPMPCQYVNAAVPDAQFPMPNVTFAQNQHANIASAGPPPGMSLTFAPGVPVKNAEGNYQMSFPAQKQMMQPNNNSPPQQIPYAFINSNGASPIQMMPSAKLASQPVDLVVHEYNPPDLVKQAATPRKVEAGSGGGGYKNYTFSNTGTTDYGEKKGKKESSTSPRSTVSTNSTS